MFEYLDLEGCIKMYAMYISEDIGTQRTDLHYRLCELLNVDIDKFRPFEDIDIIKIPTEKEAESIIRKAIKQLGTTEG